MYDDLVPVLRSINKKNTQKVTISSCFNIVPHRYNVGFVIPNPDIIVKSLGIYSDLTTDVRPAGYTVPKAMDDFIVNNEM
jgi:hypothetical protein